MSLPGPVERALERIGWGKYQTRLYFNCLAVISTKGVTTSMIWTETTSIMMYKSKDLEGILKTLVPMSLNLGTLLGCYLFSYLIGYLGRAPVYRNTIIVTALGGMIISIFPYEYVILIGLMIIGFGIGGDMTLSSTVLMESIPPSNMRVITMLNIGYSFGTGLAILVAIIIEAIYFASVPDWVILIWMGTLFSGILIWLRKGILESPMYLHSKGDLRLEAVMQQIAKINGKNHTNVSLDESRKPESEVQIAIEKNLISVFKRPYITSTLVQSIQYLTCNFAYFGMILFMPMILPETSTLESYTVILFQQICGMAGCGIAAYLIYTPLGRRGTETLGFILAGICMYPFMASDKLWIIYTFSCLISCFLMIGSSTMYTHSQELYPTHIRGLGVGWLTGMCLMTSVITPPIIGILQELVGNFLVLGICGACFFIAGSLSYLLPETLSEREVYIQNNI